MSAAEMAEVVLQCHYPGYKFSVKIDGRGALYLQGAYEEADTLTGEVETQKTRRWFLSPEMTKSEIVQTVFKCILTSMEHRTREHFTYRLKPIFGPHFDVEHLWQLCSSDEAFEWRESK